MENQEYNRVYTVEDILDLRPCDKYGAALIRSHIGDSGMKLRDILRLGAVPVGDRLWLACKALPWEIAGAVIQEEVDARVRESCLSCGVESVEAWAAAWLSGEDRSGAAAVEVGKTAQRRQIRMAAQAAENIASKSLRAAADTIAWIETGCEESPSGEEGRSAVFRRILGGILTAVNS